MKQASGTDTIQYYINGTLNQTVSSTSWMSFIEIKAFKNPQSGLIFYTGICFTTGFGKMPGATYILGDASTQYRFSMGVKFIDY